MVRVGGGGVGGVGFRSCTARHSDLSEAGDLKKKIIKKPIKNNRDLRAKHLAKHCN